MRSHNKKTADSQREQSTQNFESNTRESDQQVAPLIPNDNQFTNENEGRELPNYPVPTIQNRSTQMANTPATVVYSPRDDVAPHKYFGQTEHDSQSKTEPMTPGENGPKVRGADASWPKATDGNTGSCGPKANFLQEEDQVRGSPKAARFDEIMYGDDWETQKNTRIKQDTANRMTDSANTAVVMSRLDTMERQFTELKTIIMKQQQPKQIMKPQHFGIGTSTETSNSDEQRAESETMGVNTERSRNSDPIDRLIELMPVMARAWKDASYSGETFSTPQITRLKVPNQLLHLKPSDTLIKRISALSAWQRATSSYMNNTRPGRGTQLWEWVECCARNYYETYLKGSDCERDTMSFSDLPSPDDLSHKDRQFLAALRGLLLEQMPIVISSAAHDFENVGLNEFQELCALVITTKRVFDVQNSKEMHELERYAENPGATDVTSLREWWANVQHIATIEDLHWRHVATGLTNLVDRKLCCQFKPLIVGMQAHTLRTSLSQMRMSAFQQNSDTVKQAYNRVLRAMEDAGLRASTGERAPWNRTTANVASDIQTGESSTAAHEGWEAFIANSANPQKGKGKGFSKGGKGKGFPKGKGVAKGKGGGPLDHDQCGFCKKPGHWWRECPTLQAASNRNGGDGSEEEASRGAEQERSGNGKAPA